MCDHVFYFMITMSLMCKQQAALSDELTTAHTSTVTSHTVTDTVRDELVYKVAHLAARDRCFPQSMVETERDLRE